MTGKMCTPARRLLGFTRAERRVSYLKPGVRPVHRISEKVPSGGSRESHHAARQSHEVGGDFLEPQRSLGVVPTRQSGDHREQRIPGDGQVDDVESVQQGAVPENFVQCRIESVPEFDVGLVTGPGQRPGLDGGDERLLVARDVPFDENPNEGLEPGLDVIGVDLPRPSSRSATISSRRSTSSR